MRDASAGSRDVPKNIASASKTGRGVERHANAPIAATGNDRPIRQIEYGVALISICLHQLCRLSLTFNSFNYYIKMPGGCPPIRIPLIIIHISWFAYRIVGVLNLY